MVIPAEKLTFSDKRHMGIPKFKEGSAAPAEVKCVRRDYVERRNASTVASWTLGLTCLIA